MSSLDRKRDKSNPFTLTSSTQRKTSAEIVNEARQSLRTLRTQRPFTPRENHRQLFGNSLTRALHEGRPPSAFSLHSRNFDSPESRPGSGNRLSPLNHKPRLPLGPDEEPVIPKTLPRPPSNPLELREGGGWPGGRARILRAGSLTTLPPVSRPRQMRETVHPDSSPEQKELLARGRDRRPPRTEFPGGPEKDQISFPRPALRRTSSESGIRCPPSCVVSSNAPAKQSASARKEFNPGDKAGCQEDLDDALVWDSDIAPLLLKLECVAAGGAEDSVDSLCDVCNRLHGALAERGMLGRHCKKRAGLLRALFRLIDLNSAQLNLHLVKLCLALSVSGNNLLNICKLMFKISQSESNDTFFHDNSIIDSLLCVLHSEDVSVSAEALLYCVGTLKFLSGNSSLVRLLLVKDCMGVASQLIKKLHPVSQPCHSQLTMAGHILVQLTATLRNLADLSDSRPLFINHGILSELCLVLHYHHGDQDICTNIARIFSKLSSYRECCLALAQTPACYHLFILLLSKHQWKQDMVVRLLFILGNLASRSQEAREQLYQTPQCVEVLLDLYHTYQERRESPTTPDQTRDPTMGPLKPPTPRAQARDSGAGGQDVLVKLVRVLANMSIHSAVGPALAASTPCVQLLLDTLELGCSPENEELLVNVAATINNLSYYQGSSSVVRARQLPIAKMMLKLLLSSSMEAVLEATRVYGNLSQSRDVRDFIMQHQVHLFVLTLLDSKSPDVCFSACGVLINLALDPFSRTTLTHQGAATKLADCLRVFGPVDWQLGALVCQTLWNLLEVGGSERESLQTLDDQERGALLDILSLYLDEREALQWTPSDDMRDFHRACWESEFLPVAQRLRSRIQSGTA
ncbi:armadillo repeat-containing protein 2 [Hypomesus transpacificus]|uniref:armadillo repeat-containing protein 2 n=1 Tax=Hypomesus transpacificus TaxID=137520 RepID=UPI001F085ED0|nr:armadillo repeat-containing protein 2 [Hypomesus transpacificus]